MSSDLTEQPMAEFINELNHLLDESIDTLCDLDSDDKVVTNMSMTHLYDMVEDVVISTRTRRAEDGLFERMLS